MLKSNSISLAASLALVGSLTLVGCGSDATSETVSTNNSEIQTTQNTQTGSISGTVAFINNPTDRTIRTTDATAQIVAYNLDDNTKYTTTSTSQGEYDLSSLTEGSYQVIATSTSTTMRSISQASVQRDTRAVVDIVLQATGTIKGNISIQNYSYEYYGQPLISIPGTSYISTVDKNGNFELINVPAGEVTVSLNGYITQNVTVVGGEESVVVNLGELTDSNDDVSYVYGLNTDSTLEMRHEGIRINMNDSYTLSEFKELVSLENNASVAADIGVDFAYDWYDEGQTTNYFKIRTTSIVDAGTYTLKVATADAYAKEIELIDKVAVFSDSYTNNGVYQKGLGIAFSNPVTDLNVSSVTVTYVDDQNVTQALTLTGIEQDSDNVNSYKLVGDFAQNVEYQVSLDDPEIQEDGLFYVGDDIGWNETGITIGNTRVSYVSIDDNQENVELSTTVRFSVQNSESLDLQTLKVMMGTKELTLQNGGLKSAYDNYYYYNNNSLEIEVDTSSLSYNADVAMSITANDSYGDESFAKTVNFTTITPATVGVLPYVTSRDDSNDWIYNLNNPYDYVLKAYFNVEVTHDVGQISLYDNTNKKDVSLVYNTSSTMNTPYANNTSTGYSVGAFPSELLPNTEYTMTVAGFTATDGTAIATKTNTFKTPARTLVQHSVSNGQLVDAYNMRNRLEFATFGKLSDAEKADFVNGLDVTSFNTAMPTDKTHPTPLALWDDESPYGSKLILAFTIESGTSYELAFSGEVAKELEMTASPLTFMTQAETTMDSGSGNFTPEYNVVSNLYTYGNSQDYNLSVVNDVEGQAQVTIPYIIDENYNSSSYYECSDLYYKNNYGYTNYGYVVPDINQSVITEWMSGDDLNVTSTSLSGMSYYSHYVYDDNGQYVGSYYSCDVTYTANFSMNSDANSTVTVDVPQSALDASDLVADGFIAKDTNRTVMSPIAQEAYANVSTYSNGFSIYFSKPVSVASLAALEFNTNPNLNVQANAPYAPYYDADGNMYATEISGSFDSSAYSVFGYDVNATLTYFDKATQTTKDLNVTRSGVVYTSADLTPLEVLEVSTMDGSIYLDVNRVVDTDSVLTKDNNGTVISSAFTLSNENNESNVTASVGNAYSNYNYTTNSNSLVLDVSRSDSASECYDAMSFTLTQSESIKANGSTQTLEAGSVTATIALPAETIGCTVDTNTTVPADTNTTL